MMNEIGSTESTSLKDEDPNTPNEANRGRSSGVGEQVKELGIKSLGPLLEVLTRHKNDLSPYLDSFTKALKAGAQSLQHEESSDTDRFISEYFTEGAEWIAQWKVKLFSSSPEQIRQFLEDEGRKKPAILFGASYFAGVILGRFGRHLGKTMRTDSGQENIH